MMVYCSFKLMTSLKEATNATNARWRSSTRNSGAASANAFGILGTKVLSSVVFVSSNLKITPLDGI